MDIEILHGLVSPLYMEYNQVIKPLIAELEAREETSPQPLFNEIRALNDHIARCYRENISDSEIFEEIMKAKRHVKRLTLDCFKYLNVSLHDSITRFEKQTRNVDLTVINNGLFYPRFRELNRLTVGMIRDAKRAEAINTEDALAKYQEGYNLYCELENLVDDNMPDVKWAKKKFLIRRGVTILAWFISVLVSGILSIFISCDFLRKLILE
ncbi:hypothetical protein ACPYIV_14520 [Parabacteroides sp. ASD2025]|uniref:hypothetical protein n=1 Tax=Parabacteroides sp. ASD2025 TaxID=3415987 RepID=UPI003CF0CC58